MPIAAQNFRELLHRRAAIEEAKAKNLASPIMGLGLYGLAFFQSDTEGMEQQVRLGAGKPGIEERLLDLETHTATYAGRLGKSREFSRRAIAAAEGSGDKEMAVLYVVLAALREAQFGLVVDARPQVATALGHSKSQDVQCIAALTLALTGDVARAQSLADDWGKRFSEDTIVQSNYLPTVHAQLALSRNEPSKAIEALQAAAPYELGNVGWLSLYPVYVRGQAYLAAHQGDEAAAEFQRVLDHRGVVGIEPIGALARLGLARAYVMQGSSARARAAYQNFLTLRKDADPDIPVLKDAKREYADLQ